MYISTKTNDAKNNHYKKYPRSGKCQFCNFTPAEIIEDLPGFVIVKNKFPYEVFDLCRVKDHLMVIPKTHTDQLIDLSGAEKQELIDILARYEGKGYNVYFREPANIIKSMDHHHTHLIKLGDRVESMEYTKDPYNFIFS